MYRLDVDRSNKRFTVILSGFWTLEEGTRYLDDYQEQVSSFDPREYVLMIDARDIKTSTPEVANLFQKALQLFVQDPFKNRFMTKLRHVMAQLQIARLGQAIPGFDTIIFVESLEESR